MNQEEMEGWLAYQLLQFKKSDELPAVAAERIVKDFYSRSLPTGFRIERVDGLPE